MTYLITGCAGFIGYHLVKKLLSFNNNLIIGIDNLNNYYDVSLKNKRLLNLENKNFIFYKIDISNKNELNKIFNEYKFDRVINLAAQAGVRYSIENPDIYLETNIIGFYNILECCKKHNVNYLMYASSSSVYGNNVYDKCDENSMNNNPYSFYAATKICNEVMAASYSNLYNIKTIGLRFFTVYGPWGRPDMAIWKFVENALSGKHIKLYNKGTLKRDFTYIDDIIDGIIKILNSYNCNSIYNIGSNNPISVFELVKNIEKILGFEISKITNVKQPLGDVSLTYADISRMQRNFEWEPKTDINTGLIKFIDWYKKYILI